jgi:ABC-type molybdate transport system substrate-binding protein
MAELLRLLAAGSLTRALTGLGPVAGQPVLTEIGPSGLLRARIENGAPWDVFASADTGHPARLSAAGLGTTAHDFCRNGLAAILRPRLAGDDAAALLMRQDLRLGISTPGNDPSGDSAVSALDRLVPGLSARALRLTGGPDLPQPPEGRNAYVWVLGSGTADLFLTYRSNAVAAMQDTPGLRTLDLPDALRVRAIYSLTTRIGAPPAARALAERILSPAIRARLATLGFEPVTEDITAGVPA